jgi:hemolysin activation/secretion protein
MTITSAASSTKPVRDARRLALVITFTGIFGHAATAASSLTTPVALSAPALTTVVVDGSSAYAEPALFAAYRDQLGRPVSRDGARAIVNAIAELYVRDGYVKPEVAVVDSSTPGVLRVRVYEARVTQVVIEGDSGSFRDELEDIGARLQDARPLRKEDVPAALRTMRRYAGLAVSATTRRDPQVRNGFELVVRADFSPMEGVVRMNNRGTDHVGPAFVLGQVFANGLLGEGEKIGLIFAAATDHEEFLGGGLFVESPLGSGGTRGNAMLFRSRSAPNEAPVNLSDEYTRQRLTFRVSRPLRQDSALTMIASGAFEADDLTIDREGTAIREDRLRIVESALRASWRAAEIQFSANLQFRHGLDQLGAGLNAHDLASDPRRVDFFVTLAQASAYRRFADKWSVRLDVMGQTSGYILPDSERFKIGGDRLGRGFEVAEIAGDRGLGGKLELRRELRNTESFIGRLSSYGFYDFGAAWKQDRPGRDSATTAGLGFALQGAALTGYVEVASPISGSDIEGQREASIFAELSYRF